MTNKRASFQLPRLSEALAKHLANVPAKVLFCLKSGEFQVRGLTYGRDFPVPTELIPFELRVPNALIWVQIDPGTREPVRVWARCTDEL